MYVCSSYYKPHELARRNTIIQVFTQVGPFFSGFLMAAVFGGLDGKNGLEGWRWMFMLVALFSLHLQTSELTFPAYAERSHSHVLYGQSSPCLNSLPVQNRIGKSSEPTSDDEECKLTSQGCFRKKRLILLENVCLLKPRCILVYSNGKTSSDGTRPGTSGSVRRPSP